VLTRPSWRLSQAASAMTGANSRAEARGCAYRRRRVGAGKGPIVAEILADEGAETAPIEQFMCIQSIAHT
jgi:hypothetical protein